MDISCGIEEGQRMLRINTPYPHETVEVRDQPDGYRMVCLTGPIDPVTGFVTVRLSAEEAKAVAQALMPHPEEGHSDER